MLRYVLAAFLLTFAVGCGPDVYDESRVPEGATDTSDPSAVQMGEMDADYAPPPGAEPGPPGN